MKYEILSLQDVQVIGMSKEIAFNNPSECQKFWAAPGQPADLL